LRFLFRAAKIDPRDKAREGIFVQRRDTSDGGYVLKPFRLNAERQESFTVGGFARVRCGIINPGKRAAADEQHTSSIKSKSVHVTALLSLPKGQ
jgi:hypothetical protein